jgi:hypothetical protein
VYYHRQGGRLLANLTWLPWRRSPWSNEYDPPLEDGTTPSPKLRKVEISANEAFDTYREMYVSHTHILVPAHIALLSGSLLCIKGILKAVSHLCIYGIWTMVGLRGSFYSKRVCFNSSWCCFTSLTSLLQQWPRQL